MAAYEIVDGQQRTISIAQYVKSDFSVDGLYFHNLSRWKIQDRKCWITQLMVYLSARGRTKTSWTGFGQ